MSSSNALTRSPSKGRPAGAHGGVPIAASRRHRSSTPRRRSRRAAANCVAPEHRRQRSRCRGRGRSLPCRAANQRVDPVLDLAVAQRGRRRPDLNGRDCRAGREASTRSTAPPASPCRRRPAPVPRPAANTLRPGRSSGRVRGWSTVSTPSTGPARRGRNDQRGPRARSTCPTICHRFRGLRHRPAPGPARPCRSPSRAGATSRADGPAEHGSRGVAALNTTSDQSPAIARLQTQKELDRLSDRRSKSSRSEAPCGQLSRPLSSSADEAADRPTDPAERRSHPDLRETPGRGHRPWAVDVGLRSVDLRVPPPTRLDRGSGQNRTTQPLPKRYPSPGQAEGPSSRMGPDLHFRWWRGKDLNLRPSGYEPDELPDCSTPRRVGHVTSSTPHLKPGPPPLRGSGLGLNLTFLGSVG